jgi:CRISPR-associated protein Csb1
MTKLDLATLSDLVRSGGAAIRLRQRLQPAGGPGDKIFPPTFATGENKLRYAVEDRRVEGRDVKCVLLDSVASQANRMEEALLQAWEREDLSFPVIGVDFAKVAPDLADVGTVTSLQAPHRVADAILRDAVTTDGTLFRDTPEGQAYTDATIRDATGVYRICPTALVFGVWDSTGPKGGLGAKFQRALTSEIVAVGALTGRKVGSRIDPLAIQANVDVYHRKDDESDWTIDESEAKVEKGKPVPFSRKGADGKGKPSAVNHSNVAPTVDELAGGITFDHAIQTTVLSLPALRRLRFKTSYDRKPLAQSAAAEDAARTALAALALAGIVHQRAQGYDLRSRCVLVPESPAGLEIVLPDGQVQSVELDVPGSRTLLAQAAAAAAGYGLAWSRSPIELVPAAKLVGLVKKSRAVAAAGNSEAS